MRIIVTGTSTIALLLGAAVASAQASPAPPQTTPAKPVVKAAPALDPMLRAEADTYALKIGVVTAAIQQQAQQQITSATAQNQAGLAAVTAQIKAKYPGYHYVFDMTNSHLEPDDAPAEAKPVGK